MFVVPYPCHTRLAPGPHTGRVMFLKLEEPTPAALPASVRVKQSGPYVGPGPAAPCSLHQGV